MPPGRISITVVPHTHWDREWYQPFDEFLERLVAMMDGLIELADAGFPHFHLDGQTAMIDDYLAVRPEREPDVRRLGAEGRLSFGPWFTQMDEFLTSGESHIRNLERGLARARELGVALEAGYMPDQFGHIGQMPQLLRAQGIDRAVVWRGVPAEIGSTSFRWEAPDGSTVVTEYLAFGYGNGEALRELDAAELTAAIAATVERQRPFLPTQRMLVMMGSDHAGPDRGLPERMADADAALDDVDVRVAGLAAHLDGLEPGDVPAWRGELRSSARAHLLPNVYSARAPQKRERGRVETLVERYAEPLAALAPGARWPAERLDRAWQLLLWNGAHDSACGCSHDRVGRDVDARFVEARSIAEAVATEALAGLAARVSAAGTLRFNPSPFEREGVPALGWRVDGDAPSSELELDPVLEDGWIRVGSLAFTLRDEPDVGDLYNYCYADEGQVAAFPEEIRIEGQAVVARFATCEVAMRLRRVDGEPFLRIDGAIDNEAPDHRLRLHLRLGRAVDGTTAGAPFELVARPLVSEGSALEAPSRTWPATHVVLAGDRAAYHEGVFEYEASGDELAVTLLRAVGTISRESMPTRPWPAGPGVETPEAQLLGRTSFALGIRADAGRDDLLRDWERFAMPLLYAEAAGGGDLPTAGSLLELSGEAQLSSVRRRDGRVEVRLWNATADRSIVANVGGRRLELGPARIETVAFDR